MHLCVYFEPLCVQFWMLRPKWAGFCAPKVGRPLCAHSGLVRQFCTCARQFYNYVIGIGAFVRRFSASARSFWNAMRPKWAGLCAPTVGRPLCAHAGQAFVRQFCGCARQFCDYVIDIGACVRLFWASAIAFCDAMRLMWACFCAPMVGRPLCANSGHALVRPWWAGICMPKVGRLLCAHGGRASTRPWWAGFGEPKVGRPSCIQSGQASVLPCWAGFCATKVGRPLCANSSSAFGRSFCVCAHQIVAILD